MLLLTIKTNGQWKTVSMVKRIYALTLQTVH